MSRDTDRPSDDPSLIDPDYARALVRARAAWREQITAQVPPGLEQRVRKGLRPRWRVPRVAAAILVLGIGTLLLWRGRADARAVPAPVLRAVSMLDAVSTTPANARAPAPRAAGALVETGQFEVVSCVAGEGSGTTARLRRIEDLPVVAWAAVPEAGAGRGPEIGVTVVGEHVVFDVAGPARREYLVLARRSYLAIEEAHPGRASCRICHNRSRVGQPNPHRIVQRAWGTSAQ